MKETLKSYITGILLLLPCSSFGSLPDILRIGLFFGEEVQELEFEVAKGRFRLLVDGTEKGRYREGDSFTLQRSGEQVQLRSSSGKRFEGAFLEFQRLGDEASFRLRKDGAFPVDHLYPGELSVKAKEESLQCVNKVPIDDYIAGVVLAEAGKGHHPEFYKVQAVICRTYALHNLDKFEEQGIHLCDKVACQVYEGMNRSEPLIDSAVKATKGLVLVDEDIALITAAYHSNSGGRTAASEDAWSKALPYLRSLDDPFSKGGKHYEWEKRFPKKEWLDYLNREYGYSIDEEWNREYVTDYCPPERRVDLLGETDSIPLKKVRKDLGLNSTYFRIEEEGDTVRFCGKGFGHGVGLSQEGAMRMAELGIPYEDIIHFYYKGVHLVKKSALDFFRDEGQP